MNFDPATTKLQTLVVRSNDGDGTPVDWSTQIQINEREYDKAYLQLVNVSMRLLTKGPVSSRPRAPVLQAALAA